MVAYKSDYVAHPEDREVILNGTITSSLESYDFDPGNSSLITNPDNVSQFINFNTTQSLLDPKIFNQLVSTNIFELLPNQLSRQERINRLFTEYLKLKNPSEPSYQIDTSVIPNLYFLTGSNLNMYNRETISYLQSSSMDDSFGYITRLNIDANENNTISEEAQSYRTLQWLRDDISKHLKDIDSAAGLIVDDRDTYSNQSSGYLEVRNLNHAVIVRQNIDENNSSDPPMSEQEEVCAEFYTTGC